MAVVVSVMMSALACRSKCMPASAHTAVDINKAAAADVVDINKAAAAAAADINTAAVAAVISRAAAAGADDILSFVSEPRFEDSSVYLATRPFANSFFGS